MDIIDKYDDAKKLDNLDSYYDDLIIGFSRRKEINDVVVKSIGKGPYYVVGMDDWADLWDKKVLLIFLKKQVLQEFHIGYQILMIRIQTEQKLMVLLILQK